MQAACPVELIGIARRIEQRHIGPGMAPDRVVAALVAKRPKFFFDADQRQALAYRLRRKARVPIQRSLTPIA